MGTSDRASAVDLSLEDGPPKKSSIFSLLSLPLRSRTRNRNLAEFYVQLDEPHRLYSAGDHITGSVILSVIKPARITHLTVNLHGFVRVFKDAKSAAQINSVNPALAPSDGHRSFRYFGNGFAQLFQDEQVLCGEGRLGPRRWEFKFELVFPSKALPSSIDFERGTISYMITAVLTRPTTIAPTTNAERKVAFVEKVDVGLVPAPRERKVTMHAMHKRQRRKRTTGPATPTQRSSATLDTAEAVTDLDSARPHEGSSGIAANLEDPTEPGQEGVQVPRSPIHSDIQSEFSAESGASHNSNSARGLDGSAGSLAGSKVSAGIREDREITATVQLLKGGCLPGDLLPVKIKVEHNRRMKSLHGVIVTFYRQGRVDYSPPASLFTNLSKEDQLKLEREEFYPKSKTGLGGLSLSSAGSCSVFRKDLSQVVAPLIIDPSTLTANIATSVRVPEDVFPSIKGVPGGLIGFKYHVEVIVDLGGKLAGQTHGASQPMGRAMSLSSGGPVMGAFDGQNRAGNWHNSIVDTDHLRREKGVIQVSFEVIVGNADSSRLRGKEVARPTLTLQPPSDQGHPAEMDERNYTWHGEYEEDGDPESYSVSETPHDQPEAYFPPGPASQSPHYDYRSHSAQAPAYVPPPQLPNGTQLSEKERIREAEQRLLPSRPSRPTEEHEAGPSTLPQRGLQEPYDQLHAMESAAHAHTGSSLDDGPSAPTLADLSSTTQSNPMDDKQELERRRLMNEASAPPEIPDDYETGGPTAPHAGAAGPSTSHEPSAPMLDENEGYTSHDTFQTITGRSATGSPEEHNHRAEPLPRYER